MKAKICSRLFHYSISALLTICTVSAQSTTGDDSSETLGKEVLQSS